MAKNQNGNTVETAAPATTEQVNFTVQLHRADHPGNRSSYTIEGQSGNIVFFNSLFKNGIPPQTLTLSVEMVQPKASNKAEKEAAAIAKAAEKAKKVQAKLDAQAVKAEEKAKKAADAIAKANAVVAAAQAAVEQKTA